MYCAEEEILKAAYLPNGFIENTELTIEGDAFHHLVNVCYHHNVRIQYLTHQEKLFFDQL